MGKEALTCGPGVSAGERKRGEWEMGHRWKAGSDRWEAEAGAADAGRPMWSGRWKQGEAADGDELGNRPQGKGKERGCRWAAG
jgi:hypothetical protein